MSGFQKMRIERVPGNAMVAFRRASVLTDSSVTDVINWCVEMVAKPGPQSALYWVVPDGKGSETITKINTAPVPPDDDATNLTINLLNEAVAALAIARQRYRCDETGVLARAAWLAVYYKRTNGRLASGRAYTNANRTISASALRYHT